MVTIRFGCEFGVALGTYCQAEDIECCSLEAMDYNLWVDLVEPYSAFKKLGRRPFFSHAVHATER